MAKEIPLTIETLSQNDAELHRITSAKEIEFVMAYIAEKGTRVALYYDDGNNFHLTTLLAADSTGLWLEQSPSNTVNLRISLSKRLVFVSSHFQVKVQFIAEQAHSVLFRGYPAFFISLPANLFRLQRREYFRLLTPVENPPHCVIAAGAAATKKAAQLFPIMDINSTPNRPSPMAR